MTYATEFLHRSCALLVCAALVCVVAAPAMADDEPVANAEGEAAPAAEAEALPDEAEAAADPAAEAAFAIDNLILFLAAVLVLFMQAGFAMLEVGLNAAKNTINILSKNLMDLSVGVLLFFHHWLCADVSGQLRRREW